MNFKRVHVIVNPASGKDQPILKTLNSVFHLAGIDWDIYVTKAGGDARRLAAEAVQAGADAVAVYGGDGTVAEVAAGLFDSEMPLVILPGGTTNATARSLGISVELAQAAKLLADPQAQLRVMDMLQVGDQYFFGVIAMGIPGEVAVKANREATFRMIDALRIPYISPSLGGTESLVLHLAAMAYYDCTPEERAELGMHDNLVRLAIGLEDADDLIADLDQALHAIR